MSSQSLTEILREWCVPKMIITVGAIASVIGYMAYHDYQSEQRAIETNNRPLPSHVSERILQKQSQPSTSITRYQK